jgi:hypothetical protein
MKSAPGDRLTGTVVQNDGRTSGDSGADGDFRCLNVDGEFDVLNVDGDFDVFSRVGVLNTVGGLMMTSSRLLLWIRRFFFCDASSASCVVDEPSFLASVSSL